MAQGVYADRERRIAVVVHATPARVHYLKFEDGGIDVYAQSPSDFEHRYSAHWPDYPLRRAARNMLNSHFKPSDKAGRILRALLAA